MGSIVNTTSGPREVADKPHGFVNGSAILEPEPEGTMRYTDAEPEVIGTAPGDGWHCVYEVRDELRAIPVLCLAQLTDDKMYPVLAPRGCGDVDLTVDASKDPRFRGFIRPPEGLDVPNCT